MTNVHGTALLIFAFWLETAAGQSPAPAPALQEITIGSLPGPASAYIPAQAIERRAPTYPTRAARGAMEGWVTISYVVADDGSIIEPMIEDSSSSVFESSALASIRGWKYEPARINGAPVEQSVMHMRITFALEQNHRRGVRRSFLADYTEVSGLIQNGVAEQAANRLAEMKSAERQNLAEDAWLWWLDYQLLAATDRDETREAGLDLARAIAYGDEYLDNDVFVAAAGNLFRLQARAFAFREANRTYEKLLASGNARRSDNYDEIIGWMSDAIDEFTAIVAGPAIIESKAYVDEHGYWVHGLMRRNFSVLDIEGAIDVVDIRCERGTIRYSPIFEGTMWSAPAAWGDCDLYVRGKVGTTFRLQELPGS